MISLLALKSWSPYFAGAGIGILSWFAFATADHPLGVTTAFESTAALTQKTIAPELEQTNGYFRKKDSEGKPPKIDWEWMLVIGVFIGATLSATLSGDRQAPEVSPVWRARFGDSKALRLTAAFVAGGLMMFGARLAQGCTSGHGISGTLQLAISSWLFILLAFGIATVTAWIVYGRKGAEHV